MRFGQATPRRTLDFNLRPMYFNSSHNTRNVEANLAVDVLVLFIFSNVQAHPDRSRSSLHLGVAAGHACASTKSASGASQFNTLDGIKFLF